jgi:inhibitor of cysteine peptidase
MADGIAAALLTGSLLAAGSACNGSSMEAKVGQSITVTKADQNKTVKVATGGQVTVKLTWSPGTGYDWLLAKHDATRLRQEGEATTEPSKHPKPGASETRVILFKALKAGTTMLEFHSLRPFEKDVPPQEVFRVQVAISD